MLCGKCINFCNLHALHPLLTGGNSTLRIWCAKCGLILKLDLNLFRSEPPIWSHLSLISIVSACTWWFRWSQLKHFSVGIKQPTFDVSLKRFVWEQPTMTPEANWSCCSRTSDCFSSPQLPVFPCLIASTPNEYISLQETLVSFHSLHGLYLQGECFFSGGYLL